MQTIVESKEKLSFTLQDFVKTYTFLGSHLLLEDNKSYEHKVKDLYNDVSKNADKFDVTNSSCIESFYRNILSILCELNSYNDEELNQLWGYDIRNSKEVYKGEFTSRDLIEYVKKRIEFVGETENIRKMIRDNIRPLRKGIELNGVKYHPSAIDVCISKITPAIERDNPKSVYGIAKETIATLTRSEYTNR